MKKALVAMSTVLFALLLQTSPCLAFYDEPAPREKSPWDPLRNISLKWAPRTSVTELDPVDATTFRDAKIVVRPFTDARKDPAEIGKNTDGQETVAITTKDNVPAWLTGGFINTLREFSVAAPTGDGVIFLNAEVLKFYIELSRSAAVAFHLPGSSLYKADVAITIKFTTKDGKVLWEGMIVGAAKNFGSSYKEQNYHEAISNAVLDMVYNMLKNEQIKLALKAVR